MLRRYPPGLLPWLIRFDAVAIAIVYLAYSLTAVSGPWMVVIATASNRISQRGRVAPEHVAARCPAREDKLQLGPPLRARERKTQAGTCRRGAASDANVNGSRAGGGPDDEEQCDRDNITMTTRCSTMCATWRNAKRSRNPAKSPELPGKEDRGGGRRRLRATRRHGSERAPLAMAALLGVVAAVRALIT